MILKKTLIIVFLFLGNSLLVKGQQNSEILLLKSQVHVHEKKEYKEALNNRSEFQLFFSGLFLFYKKVISSQDSQSCSFIPSCSEYGLIAVKKQGLLGLFNTFDRLSRCNGLSPNQYTIDPGTGLLLDNF